MRQGGCLLPTVRGSLRKAMKCHTSAKLRTADELYCEARPGLLSVESTDKALSANICFYDLSTLDRTARYRRERNRRKPGTWK